MVIGISHACLFAFINDLFVLNHIEFIFGT